MKIIISLVILISLCGCADPTYVCSTVSSKRFIAAHDISIPDYRPCNTTGGMGINSGGTCYMGQKMVSVDNAWHITIHYVTDGPHWYNKVNTDCTFETSQKEFEVTNVGDKSSHTC